VCLCRYIYQNFKSLPRYLVPFIGIGFFTLLLFLFESSEPRYFAIEFFWSFCMSCVLWCGNGCIIWVLNWYVPWRNPTFPRLIIQVGMSTIFTAWATFYSTRFLYEEIYDVHFSNIVFRKAFFLFLILSWLYHATYTGWHFFKQWRKSLLDQEQLKRQNLLSQYESLKNQINPHFLFNSINTLIGLIDEDTELAKKYGQHFSKVYRYILEKGNEQLVPLSEEFEVINLQKQLLEWRFGMAIKISMPDTISDRQLPPLALQMLLENAIKHNKATLKKPLAVDFYLEGEFVVVSNNIQLKQVGYTSKLGLENIIKRYEFLGMDQVIVEQSEHFIVKLPLIRKA